MILLASGCVCLGAFLFLRLREGVLFQPVISRWSVRSLALKALHVSRHERLAQDHAGLGRAAIRIAVFAGLVLFTFVPAWAVEFGPFGSESESRNFLSTLWQVIGAAIGVSVALVALVLEAFLSSSGSRPGMSLREFAAQTKIFWLLDFAAAALVINGMALLGLGAAPGGWPGLMTTILGAATLVGLLVFVPRSILGAVEPARLLALRTDRVLETTRLAIRDQLLGQVATAEIHGRSEETGVTFGFRSDSNGEHILARRPGIVHDVWLGPLRWAAGRRAGRGEDRIVVLVQLEETVTEQSVVLQVPPGLPRWRRFVLNRSVRVRSGNRSPSTSSLLNETFAALRQQGMNSVRRGDDEDWRSVSRLLKNQLLMLPKAAMRAGVAFDGAVSSPGVFGYGPSGRALDVISDVLELAIAHGAKDIVENCMYVPGLVAREASGLNAPGLIGQCSSSYARAYALTHAPVRGSELSLRESVRENAVDSLSEVIAHVGLNRLVYGEDHRLGAGDVQAAQVNVYRAWPALVGVLRHSISMSDEKSYRRMLRRLHGIIDDADTWSATPETQALRGVLTEIHSGFLALAAWALHRAEIGGRGEEAAAFRMAVSLLGRLPLDQLLASFDRLLDARSTTVGEAASWWYYDEEEGGVQTLDGSSKLLFAVVVGLWILADLGQLEPQTEPWVEHRADDLKASIETIRRDIERYGPLLGEKRPEEGASSSDGEDSGQVRMSEALQRVEDFVTSSRDRERAENYRRVMAAPLDVKLVHAFTAGASKAAKEARVLRDLLKALGRWRSDPAVRWADRGIVNRADKRFFTGEPGYVGQDHTAQRLGFLAGRVELSQAVELMARGEEAVVDDVRDAVGRACEDLEKHGATALVVFFPTSAELLRELGLLFRARPGELDETWIPGHRHVEFNGAIGGVPAMDLPDLDERLFVVDLGAFAMREIPTTDSSGVRPTVTVISEAEAWRRIRVHSETDDTLEPSQEWAEAVQRAVELRVEIGWELRLEDPTMVRAIIIPQRLRRHA